MASVAADSLTVTHVIAPSESAFFAHTLTQVTEASQVSYISALIPDQRSPDTIAEAGWMSCSIIFGYTFQQSVSRPH